MPALVDEVNAKLKDMVALEEKVKVAESKVKEVEEESRAKEVDMLKVYDLVNRFHLYF